MEETKVENKAETSQESRKDFLDKHKIVQHRARRNIFDDYKQINSYELDLPNTQNKFAVTLHQRKTDNAQYLLKMQVGTNSVFIDAKTAFIVSEAMRFITNDIVPDDLKPTFDIRPKVRTEV